MIRLRALLRKEFIQMRRDRLTFAMMIGLPILQLLERGTTDDRAFLEAVITSRRFDAETLREVAGRVSESGMLEEARGIAASFAREALGAARSFPEGPAKDLLALLPEYILKRRY